MPVEVWGPILLLLFGIMCPIAALQFKLGKMKANFLPLPTNPQIPRDWPYGLWPGGIGSLLTGIGLLLDNRLLMIIGILGLAPFGLVLMAWKPRWLKPDWLLWLENHYDQAMLDFMFSQARRDKTWSRRVSTQQGLENWAEETAHKYDRMPFQDR